MCAIISRFCLRHFFYVIVETGLDPIPDSSSFLLMSVRFAIFRMALPASSYMPVVPLDNNTLSPRFALPKAVQSIRNPDYRPLLMSVRFANIRTALPASKSRPYASCNKYTSVLRNFPKVYRHSQSGLSSFLLMSVRFANIRTALPASSHAVTDIANLIIILRAHG